MALVFIISRESKRLPMTIEVRCPLGHRLVVKEEHAGKKVRCPKCQAVMQAPACEAGKVPKKAKPAKRPTKLLAMLCGEGHRFAVRPEHFGLTVLCPVCEQPVRVVNPNESKPIQHPPAPPPIEAEERELVGAGAPHGVEDGITHATQKMPLTDEMVDAFAEEKLLPLLFVVGTAAAVLVGIAFWLRDTTNV